MIVSYKWLQSYFKKTLPEPAELADLITMKVFEIEGLEKKDDDTIFDIKVLPDRSPYCLSHRYIAQEIGAIVKQEMIVPEITEVVGKKINRKLSIKIEEAELCRRYIGRVVEGIKIEASPDWLKTQLEVLGQRSINNIVDYTNFVMLETGQPLHAFDADKVEGEIVIRLAKEGEEIVLLDGRVIKLTPAMLVVADEVGPLAIAGVKGGKRAEISESTKNIIIESANFKGSNIRRTSQAINIRNDSSKRFENEVTPERAELAMNMICDEISKALPGAVFGEIIDIYMSPVTERQFNVYVKDVVNALGCDISTDTIIDTLNWCKIGVVKKDDTSLSLTIPLYRSDIKAIEDIVDEVGRLYGYENVPVKIPTLDITQPINKNFYYINLIKKILVQKGFSEIYTHTLKDSGDMMLENPLNNERGFLRNDLSAMLSEKLEFNLRNIDLLGQEKIKIFEIGKVFGKKQEHWSLAVGIAQSKNIKDDSANEQIRNLREEMIMELGLNIQTVCTIDDTGGIIVLNNKPIGEINRIDGIMEINIEKIIEVLPDPALDIEMPPLTEAQFKKISPYPFIVRDIAVFIPGEANKEQEVLHIIKKYGTELLVRVDLFDVFTKRKDSEEIKTSYAYRMVYQANDRTLTDIEINTIMEKITTDMNAQNGWQVR